MDEISLRPNEALDDIGPGPHHCGCCEEPITGDFACVDDSIWCDECAEPLIVELEKDLAAEAEAFVTENCTIYELPEQDLYESRKAWIARCRHQHSNYESLILRRPDFYAEIKCRINEMIEDAEFETY